MSRTKLALNDPRVVRCAVRLACDTCLPKDHCQFIYHQRRKYHNHAFMLNHNVSETHLELGHTRIGLAR